MAMPSGISRRVVPTSPDELSATSESPLDNADLTVPKDLTAGRPLAIKSSETGNLQNSNSTPSLSPFATRQSLEVAAHIDRDGERERVTPQNVRTLLENSASQGLHCRVPTTPPSDSSTELRNSTASINNAEGLGDARITKDVEGRRRESEGEKHARSYSNWSTSKRHEPDAVGSSREQLAGPRRNQGTTTAVKEGDTGANSVSQNIKNLDPYTATVRSLRSFAKLQKRSFAEENQEDISAEINSLSKISSYEGEDVPSWFVMDHESSIKLGWDIFMMILIVFSSFSNPIEIGFGLKPKGGMLVIEIVTDLAFMLDIALTFRTTMVDPRTKETVTDMKIISLRYLKGWFVPDVLSSLPVAPLSLFVDLHGLDVFFIELKLLRALKLHQLSVITNAVLRRFEDQDFNPSVFRIYIFVLAFILVLHFIACGYWWISRVSDPDFETMWTPEDYYLELPFHWQYARAIYFAFIINSGNDMKPENRMEYLFSSICLTVALITNAVIIGSATNLLSNMDSGAVAKKHQMDGINAHMRFRKAILNVMTPDAQWYLDHSERRVTEDLALGSFEYSPRKKWIPTSNSVVPPGLQKKIRSYYEYLWESGQDRHSTVLFDEMPEKLKLQLNIALKKRLIEKVPLFKTCSAAGTIALVQNLRPSIILPGELIIHQGEPATSMFLISRGTVRVFVASEGHEDHGYPREEKYVISLRDGSFFGEVALLESQTRTANVRAETIAELQVLDGDDFRALAQAFPELKTAVKDICTKRVKTTTALVTKEARGKLPGPEAGHRSPARKKGESLSERRWMKTKKGVFQQRAVDNGNIPKLKLLVERLMQFQSMRENYKHAVEWSQSRLGLLNATPASREQSSSQNRLTRSFLGCVDENPRTVYERILAHEETMSHEMAMRVARGGGINLQTLMDLETLDTRPRRTQDLAADPLEESTLSWRT